MTLMGITACSWLYDGSYALENMVLGIEERAVRDGSNHISTDEFDACLAIVICRIGLNTFAHLDRSLALTAAKPGKSGTAARIADSLRVRPMK